MALAIMAAGGSAAALLPAASLGSVAGLESGTGVFGVLGGLVERGGVPSCPAGGVAGTVGAADSVGFTLPGGVAGCVGFPVASGVAVSVGFAGLVGLAGLLGLADPVGFGVGLAEGLSLAFGVSLEGLSVEGLSVDGALWVGEGLGLGTIGVSSSGTTTSGLSCVSLEGFCSFAGAEGLLPFGALLALTVNRRESTMAWACPGFSGR